MANLYWPRHPLRSRTRQRRKRERRWQAALGPATKNLVLSHGGCLDGITSAVIARRSLTGVGVAYAQPSQVKTALDVFARSPAEGRRLIIADLSLQPQDAAAVAAALGRLKSNGWTVEWLDHHHKQWEGVDLTPIEANLDALVVDAEQQESGATLVQKRYAPHDEALRRLAETVRDRDLWWNKDPASETLEFALADLGPEGLAEELMRYDGGTVISERLAKAADNERRRQARDGTRVLARTRYFGQPPHRVGIVYGWLPRNTGLHDLLERHDCAIAINVRPNGKMSIRSRRGHDVSHIVAGAFGGGGHPNASGGDLGLKGPAYWWYVLRRGRPVEDRLQRAALRALRNHGTDTHDARPSDEEASGSMAPAPATLATEPATPTTRPAPKKAPAADRSSATRTSPVTKSAPRKATAQGTGTGAAKKAAAKKTAGKKTGSSKKPSGTKAGGQRSSGAKAAKKKASATKAAAKKRPAKTASGTKGTGASGSASESPGASQRR